MYSSLSPDNDSPIPCRSARTTEKEALRIAQTQIPDRYRVMKKNVTLEGENHSVRLSDNGEERQTLFTSTWCFVAHRMDGIARGEPSEPLPRGGGVGGGVRGVQFRGWPARSGGSLTKDI